MERTASRIFQKTSGCNLMLYSAKCNLDNDDKTSYGFVCLFSCIGNILCDIEGVRQWARILFAGSGILLFAAGILPLFLIEVSPRFFLCQWSGSDLGICILRHYYDGNAGCIAVVYGGGMSDGQREAAVPDRQDDTNPWIDADDDIPALPDMRDHYRQIHEAQIGLGRSGKNATYRGRLQSFLRELSILYFMVPGGFDRSICVDGIKGISDRGKNMVSLVSLSQGRYHLVFLYDPCIWWIVCMSAAGKSAGVLFPGACKAAHHAGNRCSISSRESWDDLAGAI